MNAAGTPSSPERLTATDAEQLARRGFALAGTARSLGSNEDQNFVFDAADGRRLLIKVSHPGTARAALDAQNEALRLLADAELRVPAVHPGVDGDEVQSLDAGGAVSFVRVLDFLEGMLPGRSRALAAPTAAGLGAAAAAVVAALADFAHPGLPEAGEWDLRQAPRMLDHAAGALGADLDARLRSLFDDARARLAPLSDALPVQAIHGDLTTDNVVADDEGRITGLIDFGDLARGWRVAEIAIAATALLHHDGDDLGPVLEAVAAFDRLVPLSDAEISALWPLIVQRAVALVASAARIAADDPDNEYAAARRPLEHRILDRVERVQPAEAELLIRNALGRVPAIAPAGALLDLGDAVEVDLSVVSSVHDEGAWTRRGHDVDVLRAARRPGGAAVTRYGEHRLRPEAALAETPRSYALLTQIALDGETVLRAPGAGAVRAGADGELVVQLDDGLTLFLGGVRPLVADGRCDAGDPIAVADGEPRRTAVVSVQLSAVPSPRPPAFAAPGHEAAWRAICPDPSPLLGRAAHPLPADDDRFLEARHTGFARVQGHYYASPPRIERGWRHQLFDVRGRGYLDMVNNVTIVGHAEPRVVDAATAQLRRLNTNSRFHYEALATFVEELTAHTPEGLDSVFLVNSGSEAVDLSLRLARAATARTDVLALTEAYHGWTVGADAVSTSLNDNPRSLDTRPDWVHLLPTPNAYRGAHRGADSHRYLDEALAALDGLDERGVSLAGMISEPVFGNGGGILLPDGYLDGLWRAVRARGGICISDEVQVGYGRLGAHFWGFEQQGVVPDVIAIAKAMGNGYPLGAVVTTAAVAEAFALEGSFFSSAGGSPVSCAVGTAVLRVIDDDELQRNAHETGGYLRSRIEELCGRHDALGAVHGMGLYLGIEVVDGGPDRPDRAAARAICNDLRGEGVIVQPTGDHGNVLKIKPPMTLDRTAVDRFAAALDRVAALASARARL